ncbi:DUF2225 domain-containing protein [Natranaerofaba carboxydovora]|uniref:DUF2225 domain-containing protein n=1 Tax=Natranaerofaba carboxydovora TaxID=2742683 RepID=UPI001F139A55|nr:DUF2225 domain-containing protein [Natranaerofaba carboxydovora]UMZ74103.1 hypothetical protein ACONDI_01682 [Natranaerofaba carboxydovora]
MENEVLYDKKYTCPLCESKFTTKKTRPSRLKVIRQDEDFYKQYEGVNPNYYLVNICPSCGYAFTDNFGKLTPEKVEIIKTNVTDKWTERDFGVIRDWNMALESFKLGFLCGKLKEENLNVLAGLLLHIAWLYREAEDEQNELRFIENARDFYLEVYEKDTSGDINLARLLYLLGELEKRLGNEKKAVTWFSRIVNDKKISDAGIIRMARDRWQELRAKKGRGDEN